MSLGVIFILVGAAIIVRDRKDWQGYAFVSIASMYLASTPQGQKITPAITSFAAWVDALVSGWFS